jgi:protein DGCR14
METARIKAREKNDWAFRSEVEGKKGKNLLDYWDHKAKNALMYYPEGLASASADSKKEIVRENTRLLISDAQKRDSKSGSSVQRLLISDGQEGNVQSIIESQKKRMICKCEYGRLDYSYNTFLVSPSAREPQSIRAENLNFVESTPLLEPGINATPILTWGVLDATPLKEDATPHTGRRFRIPDTPVRETIGDNLKAKASRDYLARRRGVASTPSSSASLPSSSPYRTTPNSLSIAARQLLKKTKQK